MKFCQITTKLKYGYQIQEKFKLKKINADCSNLPLFITLRTLAC